MNGELERRNRDPFEVFFASARKEWINPLHFNQGSSLCSPAEIQIENLQNTSLQIYRCTNAADFLFFIFPLFFWKFNADNTQGSWRRKFCNNVILSIYQMIKLSTWMTYNKCKNILRSILIFVGNYLHGPYKHSGNFCICRSIFFYNTQQKLIQEFKL
jgi:hypothetical protein